MKTWPAIVMGRLPSTSLRPGTAAPEGDDLTDLVQAALTDFRVAAIDETPPDAWRVFFHDATERDRALTALAAGFPALELTPLDVADEDWAARSQAGLGRVEVGRIVVAPPWDVPLVITIQPSMGFGTGHHATTRLCLAALQQIDVNGKTALDVGTGSAVLAIAASLLGAADVTGIDEDADAIHAAWENLALNPGSSVALIVGDLRATDLVKADVVLANLTGGLLIASADRLQQLTAPEGHLIVSGFQRHEESDVRAAFAGLEAVGRGEEEDWVCLTLATRRAAR